jgi:mitochondrial splicing suppressor protein 51
LKRSLNPNHLEFNLSDKTHKSLCSTNALHDALLQHPSNPLTRIALPDGMDLPELNSRLADWIKFHKGTLMVCSYHALSLPTDISRTKTHIMHVIVEPRADHGRNPAKYFRVKTATVPSYAEAMGYGPPWPWSIQKLKEMREESEKAGRGTETAAGVECPPLGVQMVPFGSIFAKDLKRTKVLQNWQDVLKRDVEEGKRLTRFGA